MSILDRDALAASPLADLHALASELSIDGYRRLRKAELVDAILARQGGEVSPPDDASAEEADEDRSTGRRRGTASVPARRSARRAPVADRARTSRPGGPGHGVAPRR